jgi:hypothetical protein
VEKNPEVNLPSDLNLDSLVNDFPPLVSEQSIPLKESDRTESWVSIVSKDRPTFETDLQNDRCILEH